MKNKLTKNIEWSLIIITILLVVIGLFVIYSATYSQNNDEFKKQLIWFGISIPVVIACIILNYNTIAKTSPIIYVISVGLLIAVLFTTAIAGASSWFAFEKISFQPSEFAKIGFILFLALIMSFMKKKGGVKQLNKITRLLLCIIVFAVPTALIVLQPDYGTAAAFVMAFIFMMYTAGIYKRYIIITIVIMAVAIPLLYIYVLPNHAKARIETFLNPEADIRGAGYNIHQSKLAIGARRINWNGLLKR